MSQEDQRKGHRKGLSMAAAFRSQIDRTVVEISNISEYGCQIANAFGYLKPGSRIMLRPEGFESFIGTIRWCTGGKAGVEFDVPLHPAIVDHLCREHPEQSTSIGIQLAA